MEGSSYFTLGINVTTPNGTSRMLGASEVETCEESGCQNPAYSVENDCSPAGMDAGEVQGEQSEESGGFIGLITGVGAILTTGVIGTVVGMAWKLVKGLFFSGKRVGDDDLQRLPWPHIADDEFGQEILAGELGLPPIKMMEATVAPALE
jgi:hypothetical protein